MMDKKELRQQIAMLKKQLSTAERMAASLEVEHRVMASQQWNDAQVVLLYHALPDEVSTAVLMEAGMKEGKRVLLPVVVGDELELRVYEGPEAMKKGAFGILEPTGEVFPPAQYEDIQLAIVPGVAFDPDGHRLGRGKGYYDKLLPRLKNAFKMGICWSFQRLQQIPAEAHDVKMDWTIGQLDNLQLDN
ncbi:MAG: 5-formyltetrahydrofolate cyclo-ligase [Bacteroidaceae bacterium]|nr:5-formyltetrahydrofolate cyclo-ligase [Bacteroidaceae bacterium]